MLSPEHPPTPTKLVDLVLPDSDDNDDVPAIPPAGPQLLLGAPPPALLPPMPGLAPSPHPALHSWSATKTYTWTYSTATTTLNINS